MARGNCGRRRKKGPWTICLLSGSLIGGAVFHLAKRVIVSKHLFQILVSRDTFSTAWFVLFCYLVNIERGEQHSHLLSVSGFWIEIFSGNLSQKVQNCSSGGLDEPGRCLEDATNSIADLIMMILMLMMVVVVVMMVMVVMMLSVMAMMIICRPGQGWRWGERPRNGGRWREESRQSSSLGGWSRRRGRTAGWKKREIRCFQQKKSGKELCGWQYLKSSPQRIETGAAKRAARMR